MRLDVLFLLYVHTFKFHSFHSWVESFRLSASECISNHLRYACILWWWIWFLRLEIKMRQPSTLTKMMMELCDTQKTRDQNTKLHFFITFFFSCSIEIADEMSLKLLIQVDGIRTHNHLSVSIHSIHAIMMLEHITREYDSVISAYRHRLNI